MDDMEIKEPADTKKSDPVAPYIRLEKALAETMGWCNVRRIGTALLGTPPEGHRSCRDEAMVPQWARRWADAGPLKSSMQIGITYQDGCVVAGIAGSGEPQVHDMADHIDANHAECFAITCIANLALQADLEPAVQRAPRM